ncbi:TPA: hypothetical protein ACI6KK_001701 [Neisseria meningitidis]
MDVKAGCAFRQCGGRESEGNQCGKCFFYILVPLWSVRKIVKNPLKNPAVLYLNFLFASIFFLHRNIFNTSRYVAVSGCFADGKAVNPRVAFKWWRRHHAADG